MSDDSRPLLTLYTLRGFAKGLSYFYFILLPVFFAERLITDVQLGYIGAIAIAMVIIGALVVAKWLHNMDTRRMMQTAALVATVATILLLAGSLQESVALLTVAFGLSGLAAGVGMSGVNALSARLTVRGDRYKTLARLGMITDVISIILPVLVAGSVVLGSFRLAIIFAIFACGLFLAFASRIPRSVHSAPAPDVGEVKSIKRNKPFLYILSIEFLDSFASSQLFVFLPLVFLAKGFALESSILMQSFIFLGYLTGRWFVGYLARRISGMRAVGLAEVGMVASIVLLLFVDQLFLLYVLSFALGVFARGTSPAIKAMSLDSLEDHQMKRGSALHVVAGDGGSALGQLIFGFFVAWYGANAPFIAAAIVAGLIAIACLARPIKVTFVK